MLLSDTIVSGASSQSGLAKADFDNRSTVIAFENLDGLILVQAHLRGLGGRDTTGSLVVDTGAGFVALDADLARHLGVADANGDNAMAGIAAHPLGGLRLGDFQAEDLAPVLTINAETMRRVTDRPLLGLVGESVFERFVVWVDYRAQRLVLIPTESGGAGTEAQGAPLRSAAGLRALLSPRAVGVPFRLVGDGKILVMARVSDPRPPRLSAPLTLIVDTGATKCVFFGGSLRAIAPRTREWRTLNGLVVPTLTGEEPGLIARVPEIELGAAHRAVRCRNVDAAVIDGSLPADLSRSIGEPLYGLLGYSFLKHYRLAIDFPHRVLWLDPQTPGWDDRPFEYCQVGLQHERRDGAARIAAVSEGSPAALDGISPGDEVVAVNGESAAATDVVSLARRLEGEPGSAVRLTLRRGTIERACRLIRRRLL